MGQARVLEPQETPHKETLLKLGFRYCNKHARWECSRKDPSLVLSQVKDLIPHARVERAPSTKPDEA